MVKEMVTGKIIGPMVNHVLRVIILMVKNMAFGDIIVLFVVVAGLWGIKRMVKELATGKSATTNAETLNNFIYEKRKNIFYSICYINNNAILNHINPQ